MYRIHWKAWAAIRCPFFHALKYCVSALLSDDKSSRLYLIDIRCRRFLTRLHAYICILALYRYFLKGDWRRLAYLSHYGHVHQTIGNISSDDRRCWESCSFHEIFAIKLDKLFSLLSYIVDFDHDSTLDWSIEHNLRLLRGWAEKFIGSKILVWCLLHYLIIRTVAI